jgi:cell division initiation protein
MKITPIDIQQMVFQVKFRGYDREEVNRFLEELALTVESLNRDNALLREKLTVTEQHLAELKRTESTLSNTLVSAQSLAEDVKRSAQREADLIMKEGELKASEILRQARLELTDVQRDVTDLQKQRLLMIERFRATLRSFERMLEVEEAETFHAESATADEKLAGESSGTR